MPRPKSYRKPYRALDLQVAYNNGTKSVVGLMKATGQSRYLVVKGLRQLGLKPDKEIRHPEARLGASATPDQLEMAISIIRARPGNQARALRPAEVRYELEKLVGTWMTDAYVRYALSKRDARGAAPVKPGRPNIVNEDVLHAAVKFLRRYDPLTTPDAQQALNKALRSLNSEHQISRATAHRYIPFLKVLVPQS